MGSRDVSGRLTYERNHELVEFVSFDTGRRRRQKLKFKPTTGQWCLGDTCVSNGKVVPFGVRHKNFEITQVTDFDGIFEGKGVAKAGTAGADGDSGEGDLPPKPPKAPELKPAPALEVFKADDPEYAIECKFE